MLLYRPIWGYRPCCPVTGNHKGISDKDLTTTDSAVDRKRDSRKPTSVPDQARFDTSGLPSDLAEIVVVWPDLPEHIKAAIKALVQTAVQGDQR